jgi:hypothetical protein
LTLSRKKNHKKGLVEWLKVSVLISNCSTAKKKKKKNPEKGQPASGVQKGRFFPEHQIA